MLIQFSLNTSVHYVLKDCMQCYVFSNCQEAKYVQMASVSFLSETSYNTAVKESNRLCLLF